MNRADAVVWQANGAPRSARFDDVYRHQGDDGCGGLAQAQQVFLAGCGLIDCAPARWSDAARWRIVENGFGLGLNFLATWQAWRADAQRPQRLQYDATELCLPDADDVWRSAQPFAALQSLAGQLLAVWPRLRAGEAVLLDGGALRLQVHGGEARLALRGMNGPVNSVFLDGFSPRVNADMWTPEVLGEIARLSQVGTRLASWCVAGAVVRGLAQVGFTVSKCAGLPPKRHCLRAQWRGNSQWD